MVSSISPRAGPCRLLRQNRQLTPTTSGSTPGSAVRSKPPSLRPGTRGTRPFSPCLRPASSLSCWRPILATSWQTMSLSTSVQEEAALPPASSGTSTRTRLHHHHPPSRMVAAVVTPMAMPMAFQSPMAKASASPRRSPYSSCSRIYTRTSRTGPEPPPARPTCTSRQTP